LYHSWFRARYGRRAFTRHVRIFDKLFPTRYVYTHFNDGSPNLLSNLEYTPIPTYGYVYSMVLAVSSRVFVGLPLAHDKAWLDTISAYLSEVVATANALRPYPRLLRPLLRPFLAPKSRMDDILSKAIAVLGPAILERQNPDHKANDLLGFLVLTSEVVDPMAITLKLLVLTSAAVCSPPPPTLFWFEQ
jgi:hypothetical protein